MVMALIVPAASDREKNTAVRAFCRETSAPKTGASGVRACARTLPSTSTIVTFTCAKLSSELRIAARAEKATLSAGHQQLRFACSDRLAKARGEPGRRLIENIPVAVGEHIGIDAGIERRTNGTVGRYSGRHSAVGQTRD